MPEITAIISAGGPAIRMRPLSLSKPKAMLSFMGKPLLHYLISSLKSYNISNIIIKYSINTAYDQSEIEKYFSTGEKFNANIKYHKIFNWLGNAGTVRKLIKEMEKVGEEISNPFLFIYGDSLLKLDFMKMFEFHRKKNAAVTVLFHRPDFESYLYEYHDTSIEGEKRTNYGVMDIDSSNQITTIREKPLIEEINKDFTNPVANAAVYILNKDVFDLVPPDQYFEFLVPPDKNSDYPDSFFKELLKSENKEKYPCFAFDIEDGYRFDVGKIEDYYKIQLSILNGSLNFTCDFPLLQEGIWVGHNSKIDSKTQIQKPVLIGERSVIEANTLIKNSIIGNEVHIGESSTIMSSIILDHANIKSEVTVSHSIIGESCCIRSGIHLPSNSVLGSHCIIGKSQLS